MWLLHQISEYLKTPKGQRNALFIALVVVLVFMFRSCGGDSVDKLKYEQNISSLRDSVRTYQTKNGELVSEKMALILEKSELEEYNGDLLKEIKDLKDNPIVVTKVVTEIVHEITYIEPELDTNGVVYNADSTIKYTPFKWNIDSTYSEGNYRKIGGEYTISVDTNLNTKTKDFVLLNDEIGLAFTTGLTENDDDKVEIFIKSKYPNFKAVKIDGALFDPRESKVIKKFFPPKRWGVGVYGGYGVYVDPGKFTAGTGLTFGVGISYNLFQWKGRK